jgi:hypothetical protein
LPFDAAKNYENMRSSFGNRPILPNLTFLVQTIKERSCNAFKL